MRIPDKLRKISELEPKNLAERGLKLSEETGELAAEIFKILGKKRSNVSKKETLQNLKEEAVDCLIMSFDILSYVGTSNKEMTRLVKRKLQKWFDKMEKRS